jgi:hypothetical protein
LSAAPAIDPNATLSAAPSSISHPPALPYATSPMPGVQAKKLSKSQRRETIVALAMLVLAAATAGAWFVFIHRHPPAPVVQKAVVTPPPPAPSSTPPQASIPVVQGIITQGPTPAAPAKPTPSKPAPITAKPQTAADKTTPPPATKPPASPTPAANAVPPPAAKPSKSTPPATAPAAAASDPHKLDPNANSKFKIALSHIPNGVPLTVEMNKAVYLRFISGDKTDLNNLFVPPGTQTFQVTAKNGSQQVVSNVVSSEFKAKKKKNFKIELQDQGNVPAGAAAPLSPGAQIYVSLSTPLF